MTAYTFTIRIGRNRTTQWTRFSTSLSSAVAECEQALEYERIDTGRDWTIMEVKAA